MARWDSPKVAPALLIGILSESRAQRYSQVVESLLASVVVHKGYGICLREEKGKRAERVSEAYVVKRGGNCVLFAERSTLNGVRSLLCGRARKRVVKFFC